MRSIIAKHSISSEHYAGLIALVGLDELLTNPFLYNLIGNIKVASLEMCRLLSRGSNSNFVSGILPNL